MRLELDARELTNKSETINQAGTDGLGRSGIQLTLVTGTITFWPSKYFTRIQLSQMFQQMADLARMLPEE